MSLRPERGGLSLPAARNLAALAAAFCAAWLIWNELRGRGWVPRMAPPKDRAITRIQAVEGLVSRGSEGAAELAAALSRDSSRRNARI